MSTGFEQEGRNSQPDEPRGPARHRILAAVDFSELSAGAARVAHAYALSLGGRLQLVHVVRSTDAYGAAGQELRALAGELGGDVPVETAVRVGSPAAEIVRYAEEEEVDLIVLGRHGRTGVTSVLLGSVAERVARIASSPVLLVPGGARPALGAAPIGQPARCLSCGAPSEGLFCKACRARFRALGAPPHWIAPEGAVSGALDSAAMERVLRTEVIGRLGCSAGGQTYVVPIAYLHHAGAIYLRSGEGMKVRMMRENPSVCFQVDHIADLANWQSVIVWGTFEELDGAEAAAARVLLHERMMSILGEEESALGASAEDDFEGTTGHRAVSRERGEIIARIRITEQTGRFERR